METIKEGSMRILELRSENFKKIKVIEITPKGDVVEITGPNKQGKTSVLDSIWTALKSKAIPKKPIRTGETKAENELKLGDDGIVKYIVKRTFTDKGDYLTVTNPEGAKYPSPQKMLDEFVGDLCFDPLEFIRMEEEDQRELLLNIVKFNIEMEGVSTIEDLEALKGKLYDERTLVNRNLLNKAEQLKAMPIVGEIKKVSVKDLFNSKQELDTIKKDIETKQEINEKRRKDVNDLKAAIDGRQTQLRLYITKKAKELAEYTKSEENISEVMEKKRETLIEAGKATKKEIEDKVAKNPDLDKNVQKIDNQIQAADETNAKAEVYEKRTVLIKEHKEIKTKSDDMTKKLQEIEAVKTKAVTSAVMPIEELKFDGATITYKGIPLSQISSSEQLSVSLGIAIALNPKLRVIRISDGSLLDSKNMKIIKEIAKKDNMQIWIEKVDESGKIGFYIEEGEIKKK